MFIPIAQRSMKSLNALAACVWPSLGWEWQRLCISSGWLPSAWKPWYECSSMDAFKRRGKSSHHTSAWLGLRTWHLVMLGVSEVQKHNLWARLTDGTLGSYPSGLYSSFSPWLMVPPRVTRGRMRLAVCLPRSLPWSCNGRCLQPVFLSHCKTCWNVECELWVGFVEAWNDSGMALKYLIISLMGC